jgi:hypothetical protein
MENTAFLEELRALASQEDIVAAGREMNELAQRFEDYVMEEERKLQIAQLEAEEKGEEAPENVELFNLKKTFNEEHKAFRNKRKSVIDAINAEEATNLTKKKSLINKLRETIQNEEHIGAAFAALKTIQEEWKSIGDIPRDKRQDVQNEYSKLVEDFFYNINIYKQLQEHDLKRNAQMKQAVIAQLKALENESSVKEIEHQIKKLQHDWEDIGPVTNEEWEVMKDEYWKAVHNCYSKINHHYEEQRSVLAKNLEAKQQLLANLTETVSQSLNSNTTKLWEDATAAILKFQEDWKKIGFGPRKENEEIWTAFRAQCDKFFAAKKEFYGSIQNRYDKIAEKKKTLIAKAEELKDSTDWKKTAQQLVNLQKQWKEIGSAGQRHEQRLWKQFRAACDVFFDNRQKNFEAAEAEFETNLTAKKELIAKIEAYEITQDKKQTLNDLKTFAEEFNAIGKVPMKEKDVVYNAYKKALDKHYAALKLEGSEKEEALFQAKIDTIAANQDAGRLFSREKADMLKKIDMLQHEIIQLENNLGFFANSKGADALKKEVEKKINRAKEEIVSLRQRIKMIPNE